MRFYPNSSPDNYNINIKYQYMIDGDGYIEKAIKLEQGTQRILNW